MHFQFSSFVAVTTFFLNLAPTSVASHTHRHRPRDAGSVEVPLNDLQLLQIETTTFQQWMSTWLDTEHTTDEATAIALLRQEIQAYDGWVKAWIDSVNVVGGPPPPPLPTSIPVTLPITRAKSSLVLTSAPLEATTSTTSIPKAETSSLPAKLTAASVPTPGEFALQPKISTTKISSISSNHTSPTSFITLTSQTPTKASNSNPPTLASAPVTSAPAVVTPLVSHSPAPTSNAGPATGGSPNGSNKIAVYYGQTPATSQTSLAQVCQNDNVDIVILAFLTDFFGPGGFPVVNFGSACGGQTPQMQSHGTKLLNCPDMASQIKQCQGLGKNVLLSLGGSLATSAFPDQSKATNFATQLWDLFGAGTGVDPGLRPFGDVRLDGFDVDNEDHSTSGYSTFVSSLRSAMNTDPSRKYYISAAPQCPRPDASIPLDAMQTMDFVFVQFYNNGNCNVGAPGFRDSFKAWSSDLSANGGGPKLYVGIPGCPSCAGSGYLDAATLASTVADAKAAGVSNFGGIMLWDGPEAMANQQGGKDYLANVKDALA